LPGNQDRKQASIRGLARSLRIPAALAGLVVALLLGMLFFTDVGRAYVAGPALTRREKALVSDCLEGGHDRIVKAAALCLRKRLSKKQVEGLIDTTGLYDHQVMSGKNGTSYYFAPSQVLDIMYDADGFVQEIHISGSRVLPDGTTTVLGKPSSPAKAGKSE